MKSDEKEKSEVKKAPWIPMEVVDIGMIDELAMPGQGKSGAASDMGDILKPPGQA